MSQEPVTKLATRGLSVRYGEQVALHPVDLRFAAHRITALIGPSGCGKSTLLRALNRMHDLVPEVTVSGSVLFEGNDVLHPSIDAVELRKRIGMVFQRSTPFPKSIFDNVAYGLRVGGLSERRAIEQRVEESLRAASIWEEVKDRLGASALSLSGGQQQRLCIARAIATRPEVLLLDEPASALDPISTEHIETLLAELRERYTIVLVTHSLAQAKRVSQDLAFFYLGRLVEAGPTEQVLEHPHDDRTRGYVRGRFG